MGDVEKSWKLINKLFNFQFLISVTIPVCLRVTHGQTGAPGRPPFPLKGKDDGCFIMSVCLAKCQGCDQVPRELGAREKPTLINKRVLSFLISSNKYISKCNLERLPAKHVDTQTSFKLLGAP